MDRSQSTTIVALLPTYQTYLLGLGCSRRGARSYTHAVRRFAEWLDPQSCPTDITPALVVEYQTALAQDSKRAKTISVQLSSIRRFCRWCMLLGYLRSDPTQGVRWPKLPRHLPRNLSPAQLEQLHAVLEAPADDTERSQRMFTRNRIAIWLMLYTGARIAEVAALRWEHVDLATGTLRIVEGKGLRDREMPLHPALAEALAEIEPACRVGYVCGHKDGKPLDNRSLAHIFARWLPSLGGPTITAHQLRHTFAVSLRETGADLETIRCALGHADLDTTMRYLGPSQRQVRAAIQQLPAPRRAA